MSKFKIDSNSYETANFLESINITEEKKAQILSILDNDINMNIIKTGFFGFKTEKKYPYLMAALPWVKIIHGLDQKQTEKNKEEYQIPDCYISFENSDKKNITIYVEAKNCRLAKNSDKYEFKIQKKKIPLLKNYAKNANSNILIAIYWSTYKIWTHNCFSSFVGEKKNVIDFQTAIDNDLSHIFHDQLILIKPFKRKTYFNIEGEKTGVSHTKYGDVSRSLFQDEKGRFKEIDEVIALIADNALQFNVIEENKDDIGTYIVEESNQSVYLKYTTIFENFITAFNIDYKNDSIEIGDHKISSLELIRILLVTACHDFKNIFATKYNIPKTKTKELDKILTLAYGENWEETLKNTNKNPMPITKLEKF